MTTGGATVSLVVAGLRSRHGGGMALVVGALFALAVGLLARTSGLDRDRAFYPTVEIVVASYYSLFAVMEHRHLRSFASRWPGERSLR